MITMDEKETVIRLACELWYESWPKSYRNPKRVQRIVRYQMEKAFQILSRETKDLWTVQDWVSMLGDPGYGNEFQTLFDYESWRRNNG